MDNSTSEHVSSTLAQPQESELSLEGLLQIALRQRWVILGSTILALILAFFYILKATPIYTSNSRLYVEQTGPKIINEYEGIMTQSTNYLYTQAELIKSTPIVADVVNDTQIKRFGTFAGVDNLLAYIKKNLNVNVGRSDDIIAVSFDSPYPAEAAQIVNAVVDSYVRYQSSRQRSAVSEVLKILQKEKIKRDQELSDKLKEMLEFTKQNGVVSFNNEGGNITFERLSKLSGALTEAQLAALNAKADFEAVKGMMDEPEKIRQFASASASTGVHVSLNDRETQLQSELRAAELELKNARYHCTEDHPSIKAIHAKIDRINQELNEQTKNFADAYTEVMRLRWVTAKEREDELQTSFNNQLLAAREFGIKAAEYAVLQSELKRADRICEILDDRIKELNVTEDVGALNISILEVARPSDSPSKPQKAKIMGLALILGFILGGGLALLRESLDYRLRSSEEISTVLGIPVLGVLPAMSKKQTIVARGQKVHLEPKSVVAEACRTIRTAVYFGVPNGQAKTILITSPDSGDGKTTVASNLAIVMAQAGQKTLLLDCDFRKPMQHRVFDIDNKRGLSSMLAETYMEDGAIRQGPVAQLEVLPRGPEVPNPAEILNSKIFVEMLKNFSKQYDRIIIDSPPVGLVADAQILAAVCDTTLLVLRAEKSTRKHSQQARDSLLSVGGHLLGAVVNNVSRKHGRYGYYGYGYYGHYGRYGHYGYYGESEKKAKSS
jgi:capsular exopolysaccharide synthesis family protein